MEYYQNLVAPLRAIAARTEVLEATVAPVAADGTPAPPIPDQLTALRVAITGQTSPPPATGWRMSNNRSATRLDVVETELASLVVELRTLRDVMLQGFADNSSMFALVNSERQLDLAAMQLEHSRNDLQDTKDALQDAALAQLAATDQLTAATNVLQSAQIEQNRLDTLALAARQTATEKEQAAEKLDIAALQASDATQTALAQQQATALAAVQAQQLADETKIETDRQLAVAAQTRADQAFAAATAAQTTATSAGAAAATADQKAVTAKAAADQAEADAQAAKTAAAAAQTTANTAQAGVTAANTRIDGTVASITALQTSVAAAQTTADQAKAAVTALGDKNRVLLGIVTPASVGLLVVGGTVTVNLSWTKAFADTSYAGSFLRTSGGTAAMGVSLTNKTTTSCTLVLTLTGTVSIAVPAGTGDVVLTHS